MMKKNYLSMLTASLVLGGLTLCSCTGIADVPVIPEPTPEPEEPVVKEIF
jgi:hypothetical protein